MDTFESLNHSVWECKYHVVFSSKCRRKTLYGTLRQHLGEAFRKLAGQKESRIEGGHLLPDHVHMPIAIPPKYAVSQVVGFLKGKSAMHLARVYGEHKHVYVADELRFTRDPFDTLIVPAARALDLPLVTRDAVIRASGTVRILLVSVEPRLTPREARPPR